MSFTQENYSMPPDIDAVPHPRTVPYMRQYSEAIVTKGMAAAPVSRQHNACVRGKHHERSSKGAEL